MYEFVIFVLYFTISGLLLVSWFALRNWKSSLHTYLFFSCIANLVYDTGCLVELHARDQGTYVAALKIGYLGRLWIGFALILFIAELCDFYIPTLFKAVAAIIHMLIYFTILNLETSDLYYNYMEFTMDGDFPKLLHSGGPLYYVQTAINLIYVVMGIFLIVRAFVREKKNKIAKKRYLMMSIAITVVGASYIIYFFKLIPLARKFDVMIIGYAICTIFMIIAIIKYRMLDATSAAKDYVVDELSEAVIVVDAEENIAYFNNEAGNIFPELKLGVNAKDYFDGLIENIGKLVREGKPVTIDDKIYTPKSNELIVDGKRVGMLYSYTDDTEHYRYMERLKTEKQSADEANKAKSQFLANMSHEIRTPINAVLGLNEMIIRECEDAKKKDEKLDDAVKDSYSNIGKYAGNIKSAGGNLLAIINDILDFSKIEAGKMELADSPYRLSSLLNDVSNMIFFKARDKGLNFEADVDESLPDELKGDEVRIKQIVTNILSNAVKYTDSGNVKLTVRGDFSDKKPGDMIRLYIEVRDTGIGIRQEDMDRLFNKFQRLEMDRNSTVEGTGLGLAIAEQLLSIMDGSIDVESKYGEGSIFKIEIPQVIVSTEPVGDFKSRFEKGISSSKDNKETFKAPDAYILVVDDTRMNLTVAKGLLKKNGMNIDTAGGGEEAVSLAKDKAYDIILMDQRMPGMGGTEALHAIREQEDGANRETPVICMTADAIIGAKERYIAEGFNDYLSKPIDSDELEQKIIEFLPKEKVIFVNKEA